MATPQETRFLRLALTRKLLTREQMKTCLELQSAKAGEGSKLPLWDCTVLTAQLDQNVVEKLQEEAGELEVEKLGKFALVRKLGEGGMGSVWLALDPEKKRVAVKLLPPHLARQRQFLTRFFREAQASIRLRHDNIVHGVEVAEDQGRYYFAMEFVQGRSVRDIIEEAGAIDADEATQIVLQVARGLDYAHKHGVVHRDIKPDNIMVTNEGVAKVTDLGLARQVDAEMTALTRTGTGMGTPFYMAPEQSTDAKRADARSDIYSLGATWYHMVTGELPFSGQTPIEILQKHLKEPVRAPATVRPGVPRPISAAIQRMMAKKPEDRVQTCEELVHLIEDECLGERDIARELGLAKRDSTKGMWEVRVPVRGRMERRRMSMAEMRERIRKGRITRETPARRVGAHEWQPASTYRELQREFPRDYAVRAAGKKDEPKDSPRAELHTLVTHFDQAKRSHARRKRMKRLAPLLIQLGIVLAVGVGIFIFRAQIWGFVSGLLDRGAEAPAP